MLLRAGALPADLTIVEERTVGPSLGQDSIRAGAIASLVALILVVDSWWSATASLGLFADLAMVANSFLMIGIITLTGTDPDASGHRRHRAHYGRRRRCQRADL